MRMRVPMVSLNLQGHDLIDSRCLPMRHWAANLTTTISNIAMVAATSARWWGSLFMGTTLLEDMSTALGEPARSAR